MPCDFKVTFINNKASHGNNIHIHAYARTHIPVWVKYNPLQWVKCFRKPKLMGTSRPEVEHSLESVTRFKPLTVGWVHEGAVSCLVFYTGTK